jgi:hypothetical protein
MRIFSYQPGIFRFPGMVPGFLKVPFSPDSLNSDVAKLIAVIVFSLLHLVFYLVIRKVPYCAIQ